MIEGLESILLGLAETSKDPTIIMMQSGEVVYLNGPATETFDLGLRANAKNIFFDEQRWERFSTIPVSGSTKELWEYAGKFKLLELTKIPAPIQGENGYVVGISVIDIAHLEEEIRAAKDQAYTDELTGLHNRRYFRQFGGELFDRMKRSGKSLIAMLLDVDHFKSVNDTYGHDAGDRVLFEFSNLMKEEVKRSGDIIARYGGEEFAILLGNTDIPIGYKKAEEIRRKVGQHQFFANQANPITASIGIATVVREEYGSIDSLGKLVTFADRALLRAKESGRNKTEIYTS